jgi:hypothetical protein
MPETPSACMALDREHHFARVVVAVLLVSLAALGFTAQAADADSTSQTAKAAPTSSQPSAANSKLPNVTIEAARGRKALRLKVDHFVTSVVVKPWNDALDRWGSPICPLVAGLPKNWGELILERISKAAMDARAPLAGRVCDPNLYVLATDNPDPLLKELWARSGYRRMYDYSSIESVKRFMHSSRPIRVWYNSVPGCAEGGSGAPANATVVIGGFSLPGIAPVRVCRSLDSRLSYGSTGSIITSAIVVIDLRRMKKMTIGQMGDYVALVSLADVQLDADPGTAPSILQLFSHGAPPEGLTVWDRALLYSLYNTSLWSKLQLPELEMTMVNRIAP